MNLTIAQIASVVLCAMGSGVVLSSMGHSPILGYIIAGVLLGPSCLQFITDRACVEVFSEMGILFLMFVIGLGLSLDKVKNMWKKSMSVTIISTLFTYLMMLIAGKIMKISSEGVILMTFCVTLSSTAVTVKSMHDLNGEDKEMRGNTYGILISQDIIAILMVLSINFMGTQAKGVESHRLVALVIFMAILAFVFVRFNSLVQKLTLFIKKHGDMLTMLVFSACLGGAVFAELFGLSASFGAFIAGLILGNSNMSEEIQRIADPIEEILLMTFFLGIGLLVDLEFVWNNFLLITSGILFVTVGKMLINVCVLRLCRFQMKDSLIISVLLAHIGEFSFMLATTASKVGVINDYGLKFLTSLTALSLFLSPFWLLFAKKCSGMAENVTFGTSIAIAQDAVAHEFIKIRSKCEKVCEPVEEALDLMKEKIFEKIEKNKIVKSEQNKRAEAAPPKASDAENTDTTKTLQGKKQEEHKKEAEKSENPEPEQAKSEDGKSKDLKPDKVNAIYNRVMRLRKRPPHKSES